MKNHSAPRSSHHLALRGRAWLLITLAMLLSGCATFYRHHVYTKDYTLYTDLTLTKTVSTCESIKEVMHAYRNLFPVRGREVSSPLVICSEDPLAAKEVYTSDFKQEGYYLPLFGLIHLTRQFPSEEGGEERTIILHELTHHFLISCFPDTRSSYWLNEGLACCLEVSFFDARGELQLPLFHPWLYRQAHNALIELGEADLVGEVDALLDSSWFHFHQSESKSRNYALSWGLTYRLLQRYEGTFEERIAKILELTPAELHLAAKELPRWLDGNPEDTLEKLAGNPVYASWAVERWLELDSIDAARLLPFLTAVIEPSVEAPARTNGLRQLTKLLARRPRNLSPEKRTELQSIIRDELRGGSREAILQICKSMQTEARHRDYLPPLVDLLASEDPDLRAAAAQALARISRKPTIVRPDFWRSGMEAARSAEVVEWRRFLAAQAGSIAEPVSASAIIP